MANDSDALFRSLFERHPAAMLLLDEATESVRDANEAAARLYGRARSDFIGLPLHELAGASTDDLLRPAREPNAPRRVFAHHDLAGGEPGELDIELVPASGHDGSLLFATLHDITDRSRHLKTLEEYRTSFEQLPVAFYRATPGMEGHFVRANPALAALFDADRRESILGMPVRDFYVDPAERQHFSDTMLELGQAARYEIRMRTLSGREIWVADTAYVHRDETGQIVFDGVLEDITRRRELEAELAHQATHDPLTELYNRRCFDAVLDQEVQRAERYGNMISAVMLDLDHFKRINDTYGHHVGDQVLQEIGRMLLDNVRETDCPARWGGEEFLVLLPGTGERGALDLAEKLRVAIGGLDLAAAGPMSLSASAGTYAIGEGAEGFVRRLDEALYVAKHSGRNCVQIAHGPADPLSTA